MSRDVRTRALAYLRSGAVTVLETAYYAVDSPRRPHSVIAQVVGHRSTYLVHLDDGTWSCTCHIPDCPHVAAVQLVTGHPSPASPAVTTPGAPHAHRP